MNHFRKFGCLSLHHYLVEVEDYIGFNETVTLAPGMPLVKEFTAMIVDDNQFELINEPFEIRMELAQLPSFGLIELRLDQREVNIRDNDGWFV